MARGDAIAAEDSKQFLIGLDCESNPLAGAAGGRTRDAAARGVGNGGARIDAGTSGLVEQVRAAEILEQLGCDGREGVEPVDLDGATFEPVGHAPHDSVGANPAFDAGGTEAEERVTVGVPFDFAAEGEEENKGEEEENAPLVLINPDPNLSNDEYEAHLASLVQQQQEKELRVAKRKEREKERARTQELVKAGLIPAPLSAKKKSSYVPVAYKKDGRGRPRKHFDGIPPAPILSVSANEAEEAPLTNNKKARFTSTAVLHQQQQQQQQQQLQLQQRQRQQQQKDGFEQIQEHHQPRAGHDSFVVDTQGVDGISHEEIANESIVAKATRAGMKNWNSKVNKFYSTAFFTEIIDPKLPTSIPAFAFKMSQNDAEREKILTQNAMRRVFNEFAEGCDPVKQSLNELSASLERLRAQQGNHENVMYSALIYAVACYRSDYPEEATLALSKAWDVYYSLKGGNETNAQNAAFMDKIRKDYEKIVSEALDT